MNRIKFFLLSFIIVFSSSCRVETINLEGWWTLIPDNSDNSYNPLFSNQDTTVLNFNAGVLEVPSGVKMPNRSYGNHLPYYIKENELRIFSPIENNWLNFEIKRKNNEYGLFSDKGSGFTLAKIEPTKSFVHPQINRIELLISDDSLALNENPKKLNYLFDFNKRTVDICVEFYENHDNDFSLNSRLTKSEIEYLRILISRLDNTLPKQFEQKVSDVPRILLLIKYSNNTMVSFDIGDRFNLPT